MIFKIAGGMLVVLGTVILGFAKSTGLKKRYKNLLKIITCFEALENEIALSNNTLDEMFCSISDLNDFRYIFKTATEYDKDIPLKQRYKKAVLSDFKTLFLKKEDAQILCLLSGGLGNSDRKGQIKNIEYVKNILTKAKDEAYDRYKNDSKLINSMYLCIGLFITVLLL